VISSPKVLIKKIISKIDRKYNKNVSTVLRKSPIRFLEKEKKYPKKIIHLGFEHESPVSQTRGLPLS
jgi:hypothetical protein